MKIVEMLPWWSKILLKLVFSRLPFNYAFWQKLGLFRHGKMDHAEYVQNNFHQYFSICGIDLGDVKGKTVLELGPGDTIATALIASSYGLKTILLDVGSFAVKDVAVYKALAKELVAKGYAVPSLDEAESLDDILRICEARYLTNGLEDLFSVEDNSVHLIVSQAVLEHIRKAEFVHMMEECRRVTTNHGFCVHVVDLKDHLSKSLNNLRFREQIWESDFFSSSGFYTNRIQCAAMLSIFEASKFHSTVIRTEIWDSLPISRKSLAPPFNSLSNEELNVSEFVVLLRPV
jgi:hypothetical protein